jgi:hypothetical protein
MRAECLSEPPGLSRNCKRMLGVVQRVPSAQRKKSGRRFSRSRAMAGVSGVPVVAETGGSLRQTTACGRAHGGGPESYGRSWWPNGRGNRDGACGRFWMVDRCASRRRTPAICLKSGAYRLKAGQKSNIYHWPFLDHFRLTGRLWAPDSCAPSFRGDEPRCSPMPWALPRKTLGASSFLGAEGRNTRRPGAAPFARLGHGR